MSKSKAKGTAFETLIVNYLRDTYPNVERRTLSGIHDKGDIAGTNKKLVWECKDHKTLNFSGWLNEAEVERENAGAEFGIVVAKRRGHGSASSQYAVLTLETLVQLLIKAGLI
jgi:Holliday junction resolvase